MRGIESSVGFTFEEISGSECFRQRKENSVRVLNLIVPFLAISSILSTGPRAQTYANNTLPPLTGSYGVGRTSFHWTDNSRLETMSQDPKQHRELMVHVFYPIDPTVNG